jgi:hypothetical protein
VNTPPLRWPGSDEPLPEISVDMDGGDELHRAVMRTAASIIIMDSPDGEKPPVVLLRWALGVWRCFNRVPEA